MKSALDLLTICAKEPQINVSEAAGTQAKISEKAQFMGDK